MHKISQKDVQRVEQPAGTSVGQVRNLPPADIGRVSMSCRHAKKGGRSIMSETATVTEKWSNIWWLVLIQGIAVLGLGILLLVAPI